MECHTLAWFVYKFASIERLRAAWENDSFRMQFASSKNILPRNNSNLVATTKSFSLKKHSVNTMAKIAQWFRKLVKLSPNWFDEIGLTGLDENFCGFQCVLLPLWISAALCAFQLPIVNALLFRSIEKIFVCILISWRIQTYWTFSYYGWFVWYALQRIVMRFLVGPVLPMSFVKALISKPHVRVSVEHSHSLFACWNHSFAFNNAFSFQ